MSIVVYVDVLVALNMIISFFLLASVKRLLREQASAWRVLIGTAIGGVYSLAIFLPRLSVLVTVPARAVVFAAVTLCVFGFGALRRFLRCWAAVCSVNLVFAGLLVAVWLLFKPSSLALKNGAVYFDIGFLPLVLCAAALYCVLRLIGKYLTRRNSEDAHCEVYLEHKGRTVKLKGIIDTGNTLTDSFTGKKVSVISQQAALDLLPKEYANAVLDPLTVSNLSDAHLIPTGTVNGEGLMLAVKTDRLTLLINGEIYTAENVAVAVSTSLCSCDVLLNADILFDAKKEKTGGKNNAQKVKRAAGFAADSSWAEKQRGTLHKRSGDVACAAESGTGAGDNRANSTGR